MIRRKYLYASLFFSIFSFFIVFSSNASRLSLLNRIKKAYPEHIVAVSQDFITWKDGTKMSVHDLNVDGLTLLNELKDCTYEAGLLQYLPHDEPLCASYTPFFRKMYGETEEEVKSHLTYIDWLPNIFGRGVYRLCITMINGIDQKLKHISDELEDLIRKKPHLAHFLAPLGGGYKWRNIAHTHRQSMHSFGIAVDINASDSNYWQWDLEHEGLPLTMKLIPYHNNVPYDIVRIFEKYGFIWGGKWYHYDTMHFEYRPELLSQ